MKLLQLYESLQSYGGMSGLVGAYLVRQTGCTMHHPAFNAGLVYMQECESIGDERGRQLLEEVERVAKIMIRTAFELGFGLSELHDCCVLVFKDYTERGIRRLERQQEKSFEHKLYIVRSNICPGLYVGVTDRSIEERHREHMRGGNGAYNPLRDSTIREVGSFQTRNDVLKAEEVLTQSLILAGVPILNSQYADSIRALSTPLWKSSGEAL